MFTKRHVIEIGNSLIVWVGLLSAVSIAFGIVPDEASMLRLVGLIPPTVAAAAGVLLWWSARYAPDDDQYSFRLIGLGVIAAGAGAVVRGTGAVADTSVVAVIGEVTGLIFYPLVIAGLIRYPSLKQTRAATLRTAFDTLAGSVAALVVGWELVGDTVFVGAGPIERFISAAYPAAALVLFAVLMAVLIRRSPYVEDRRLVTVALGTGAVVVFDVFEPVISRTSVTADVALQALWLAAFSAFGVAASMVRRPPRRRQVPMERPPAWKTMLPYGFVAVLVTMFFVRIFTVADAELGLMAWATLLAGGALAGRQSVGARERREMMERERDEIVVGISRRLRNPLAAVTGFAEVLERDWETQDDAERREMVRIIAGQARELGLVVADFLELARGELSQTPLSKARLDGKGLVAEAIVNVWDIEDGPPPVKAAVEPFVELVGDRRRLLQVLVSLLENAKNFGGGKVVIVVKRSGSDRVIEIHDDGPGVPPRFEGLIWERFERGENQFNEAIPGTGIGLAVVRALVEAHGGTVGYRRSERLGGACFWLSLPYDVAEPVVREEEPVSVG